MGQEAKIKTREVLSKAFDLGRYLDMVNLELHLSEKSDEALNAIEEILLDKSSLRRMDYKDLISLHQAILRKKQLSVNMVRTFVDDTIKNSFIKSMISSEVKKVNKGEETDPKIKSIVEKIRGSVVSSEPIDI